MRNVLTDSGRRANRIGRREENGKRLEDCLEALNQLRGRMQAEIMFSENARATDVVPLTVNICPTQRTNLEHSKGSSGNRGPAASRQSRAMTLSCIVEIPRDLCFPIVDVYICRRKSKVTKRSQHPMVAPPFQLFYNDSRPYCPFQIEDVAGSRGSQECVKRSRSPKCCDLTMSSSAMIWSGSRASAHIRRPTNHTL